LARTSWFKKIWKGRSKGVSTVIGTVFLILIIFMVSTNVLLWTFSQNAEYSQAVMEKNEEEAQRSTENIAVSDISYNAEVGQVHVEAKVTNEGPVPVQITTLWVLDNAIQKYGYNDAVSINLKAGDTFDFTGSNALTVAIENSGLPDELTSWFITARGNLIPLEEKYAGSGNTTIIIQEGTGYPEVTFGALVMDFDEFRYFAYMGYPYNQLINYPDGNLGFNIPKQVYVAYGCMLTNVDPSNRTMVLDSHSLLWQPGRSSVPESGWFIVNVNGTGLVQTTFSPITIGPGETKLIVFASDNDLSQGGFKRLDPPNVVTTVATFLLLHGTLDSSPYAQNVPFVSLFYS